MQRQPAPLPGPAGTFKRSTAASSRTPEALHLDLGPPQAHAKAGNEAKRQLCGVPRLGPTPKREVAGPGRDSPASAARGGDGPGRG